MGSRLRSARTFGSLLATGAIGTFAVLSLATPPDSAQAGVDAAAWGAASVVLLMIPAYGVVGLIAGAASTVNDRAWVVRWAAWMTGISLGSVTAWVAWLRISHWSAAPISQAVHLLGVAFSIGFLITSAVRSERAHGGRR